MVDSSEEKRDWIEKSMKKEWLTPEKEMWENKIKECKNLEELSKVEENLVAEMQKHGGLPGNDYWVYHGTPTYPGIKRIIDNKKNELMGVSGGEEETIKKKSNVEKRDWIEKSMKKEWLTPEKEMWENKIKECKNLEELSKVEENLVAEMQKHGGLPGNDYWVYHGTPTYPGIKRIIDNKKNELMGVSGGEEETVEMTQNKFSKFKEKIRGSPKGIYTWKPSKNFEDYAKIILPIIALVLGLMILIFFPNLWVIGVPLTIVGIGYLLFVLPETSKLTFKQKIGVWLVIIGILATWVFGFSQYIVALFFLGVVFIIYDSLPEGVAKLGFRLAEFIITLFLLILVVPTFLSWTGIEFPLLDFTILSIINIVCLFILWSFGSGKSIKESLEEELLRLKIENEKKKKKEGNKDEDLGEEEMGDEDLGEEEMGDEV